MYQLKIAQIKVILAFNVTSIVSKTVIYDSLCQIGSSLCLTAKVLHSTYNVDRKGETAKILYM